jgi:thiamine biosynthesis lipoprotein
MKPRFLSILIALLPLHGAERTRVMMGTYATVTAPDAQAHCIDNAFAAMARVEKALSSYDPEAEVYRLNRQRRIRTSAMLHDALEKSERYYRRSGGYFDVTIGSLTRGAYRFGEAERIPDRAQMQGAAVGLSLLEFNATSAALKPGAMLDLGGFGKGYGVDRASAALKRCGVKKGRVALSGDIRCLGTCLLGVQDPFSDRVLLTFETVHEESGISTSGNYRRYVGDTAHSHLLDPKTRTSERAFASVTLIGTADSSDLDAWTTSAAVMPPKEAEAFLSSLGVAYLLVYNDGTIVKSANLAHYVTTVEKKDEDD